MERNEISERKHSFHIFIPFHFKLSNKKIDFSFPILKTPKQEKKMNILKLFFLFFSISFFSLPPLKQFINLLASLFTFKNYSKTFLKPISKPILTLF